MRLHELKQKEIINCCTCRNLGCPIVQNLTAAADKFVLSSFRDLADCTVSLEKIRNSSFHGNVSVRLVMILSWWKFRKKHVSVKNNLSNLLLCQTDTLLLSRTYIFYIFPKKEYFSSSL